MAPAYAVPRLLARHGLSLQDFDLYEIHEAFAATVLSTLAAWEDDDFCRERLGLDAPLGAIDRSRLNVNGLLARRRTPVRRDRGADRRHAREAAPREGAGLARPDLDLRRRWPGRRRDPRGGLTWRTATATRPSSPPALGKRLADDPRAAPAGGAAPPRAGPTARRRPGARRRPRRHPGPRRAARRADRRRGAPSSTTCPRTRRLGGVVVDLTAGDGPRPTSRPCAPPSARR